MRAISVAVCAILLIPTLSEPLQGTNSSIADDPDVVVCASLLGDYYAYSAAMSALLVHMMSANGVRARGMSAPAQCRPPAAADGSPCGRAVLAALEGGALTAAVLAVPAAAAPATFPLRELGIEDVGDAAPPARRACVARPPLRSLLDLATAAVATQYRIPAADLLLNPSNTSKQTCKSYNCINGTFTPEWCEYDDKSCATIVANSVAETTALTAVVQQWKLRAQIVPLGARLDSLPPSVVTDHRLVVCDWAHELVHFTNSGLTTLGPPPCSSDDQVCPFEARRLVKFVNVRALARVPSAIRSLVRLQLSATELHDLSTQAVQNGPEAAARRFLESHPAHARLGEVRVAVFIPSATRRHVQDAAGLAAAAALAEEDLETEKIPKTARFKVEVYDDGCDATKAYKYLIDALGTGEYGALSGVAGPACGAAFADVARQSLSHALPVLAYTPQPAPADARYTLLAAGDSREATDVLGALMAAMDWQRIVVLSEPATRALVDSVRLKADIILHVELPDDKSDLDYERITQWGKRAAAMNGRIIYLCLEDARAVRAALCAGRAAGLTPAAGAVWLLPAALPADWLQHASLDPRNDSSSRCSADELADTADTYLSVVSSWQKRPITDKLWKTRWRAVCRRSTPPGLSACRDPSPSAAVLYDTLRLWAEALDQLLTDKPTALDDLHDPQLIRSLIGNATTSNFTGLSGAFSWKRGGGVNSRETLFFLIQQNNGTQKEVGNWNGESLTLEKDSLKWRLAGSNVPDDGGERCALQPLAELLHCDCRTALLTLGGLLVGVLAALLAGGALYCKRRVEREYRERLTALGLRVIAPKTLGLDRWELPRERVVINRKLGMGAFGTVYGGHALLAENRGWTAVAVKTLKAGATTEEKLDFLSEAEAMKRFDHKNVIRLLGVVTKTQPVCTVMEFMLYGDLKNYLLARRHLVEDVGDEESRDEVSPRRLTSMARDVARALSYLASLRYVHRDVAARNCLVSAHRQVKLADFGMTRLVFENDYYRFSRKGMLPVRWMAPESLCLGVFSPASDVWSFGVLLYEIVTFGSLPFQGMSNSEVLAHVKTGRTLDLPAGIKPQLESLFRSCWQRQGALRPSAAALAGLLGDAPRLLAPCLDVPLDALPLDPDPPWRVPRDRAEARWISWAAPTSAATDTTYLSTDAPPPNESDAFLP